MQPQVTSLRGTHTPVRVSYKLEEMGTLPPLLQLLTEDTDRQRGEEAHTPTSGAVPLSWSGCRMSPAVALRGIYGVSPYRDG